MYQPARPRCGFVSRRTGGLENPKTCTHSRASVSRRTGGLEMHTGAGLADSAVSRRTGGLENKGSICN